MNDGAPPAEPPDAGSPLPLRPVRTAWLVLGAVTLLLVGGVAGGTLWRRPRAALDAPAPSATFAVIRGTREAAADFTLSGLDGGRATLSDFRGRVVLVNFWATWCAPCREEMPAMEGLVRDFGARGLVVLAVNFEEDLETVRAFARETGLSLPVLLDPDGAVARRYRVMGLPTTILIDRGGAVAGTAIGFRDWAAPAARGYVRELLGAGEA